jgi:hypothetical protein
MKIAELFIFSHSPTGCGAGGSVHAWGACGRWFESSHPD